MPATKKARAQRIKTSPHGRSSAIRDHGRGSAKMTTDHETIRRWAEKRGGHPATVKATTDDTTGVLRIDFPGFSGERSLKEVSWNDFFKKFDREHLAFLYQEKTASGRTSRFGKFVDRNKHSNR
jgi:hypothetical protein